MAKCDKPRRAEHHAATEQRVPASDFTASAACMDALTAISARGRRRDPRRPRQSRRSYQGRRLAGHRGGRGGGGGHPCGPGAGRARPCRSFPRNKTARSGPVVCGASYALVDPLDGTREFIAGRDEYTINIAIVSGGVPVIGIVAAPALGLAWRGIVGVGAERFAIAHGESARPTAIRTRPRPRAGLVATVSRSHLDARTQAFVAGLAGRDRTCRPAPRIKFCRLAEGAADVYPRLAPTREWDVAAGHAVLAAAGGMVVTPDGTPLRYGSDGFLIPGFVAWGDPAAAGAMAIKA